VLLAILILIFFLYDGARISEILLRGFPRRPEIAPLRCRIDERRRPVHKGGPPNGRTPLEGMNLS
jgi:hypothetical protein